MAENLLPPVPVRASVVGKDGIMTQVMVSFLNTVRRALGEPDGPPSLKAYVKADVPAASSNLGKMIWLMDATGGPFVYVSNGTDWIRMSTEAVLA